MTIENRTRRMFATAMLASAVAATPLALSVTAGLHTSTAAAREAESGGNHAEPGDDKGGNRGGDDKGGRGGGDDHPGSHSQNGRK